MRNYYEKGNVCPKCLGLGEVLQEEGYYDTCDYCLGTGWNDDLVDKTTGLRIVIPKEQATRFCEEDLKDEEDLTDE